MYGSFGNCLDTQDEKDKKNCTCLDTQNENEKKKNVPELNISFATSKWLDFNKPFANTDQLS